jgi:hypothetical protein
LIRGHDLKTKARGVEETNEQTRHMNVTQSQRAPKRSLEHMTSDVDGTRSGVVMKRQKRKRALGRVTWRKIRHTSGEYVVNDKRCTVSYNSIGFPYFSADYPSENEILTLTVGEVRKCR